MTEKQPNCISVQEEKKVHEETAKEHAGLIERLKNVLGEDEVKEVRVSSRLTDSPACLVVEDNDMSANLERLLKSVGQEAPSTKPIIG